MTSNIRLLALLLLGVQVAAAQQMSWGERSTGPVQFKISAQPMDRALEQFAWQAKLQLIFSTDDIGAGMVAKEVSGLYLPEVALNRLLANTCLGYKFVNSRTIAIEKPHGRC